MKRFARDRWLNTTTTVKDPYKGVSRSDCEHSKRTAGNVHLPFAPSDSLLLDADIVKFK